MTTETNGTTSKLDQLINGEISPEEAYPALPPLAARDAASVKLVRSGPDEKTLMASLGYSAPIAEAVKRTTKMYGFIREGALDDPLAIAALRSSLDLHVLIFNAPCTNRQGRYDLMDTAAQQWARQMKSSAAQAALHPAAAGPRRSIHSRTHTHGGRRRPAERLERGGRLPHGGSNP